MALAKDYTDVFGVAHAGAYWKLTGFQYDNFQQVATLTFSCYASKDASDTKMQPFTTHTFTLKDADFAWADGLLQAQFKGLAYTFAKTHPDPDGTIFFNGAADV